jgi:hypothetical protein
MSFRFLSIVLLSSTLGAQTASPAQGDKPSPVSSAAMAERSGRDPLLDLPPLPKNSVTLVGGTLLRVDRVRDRIAVKPFGGREMEIAFDTRTRMLRDQASIGPRELSAGSRVYVDTLFDGSRIFAKSIQVRSQNNCGDAHGQVIANDLTRGTLDLREEMSSAPLRMKVTTETLIRIHDRTAAVSEIPVGAVAVVSFATGPGDRPVACDIHVLAVPGQAFTFFGTITFVDLRAHRIAITNRSDDISYSLSIESLSPATTRELAEGVDATIEAVFDGQNYVPRTIEIKSPSSTKQAERNGLR